MSTTIINTDKIVSIDYPVIKYAHSIESILCLTALIASGILHPESSLSDATSHYMYTSYEDCNNCQLKNKCLTCIINQ
jgi:hypothetical protein